MSKLGSKKPSKSEVRKKGNGDFAAVKIADPAVRPSKTSVADIRRAVRAARAKRSALA